MHLTAIKYFHYSTTMYDLLTFYLLAKTEASTIKRLYYITDPFLQFVTLEYTARNSRENNVLKQNVEK